MKNGPRSAGSRCRPISPIRRPRPTTSSMATACSWPRPSQSRACSSAPGLTLQDFDYYEIHEALCRAGAVHAEGLGRSGLLQKRARPRRAARFRSIAPSSTSKARRSPSDIRSRPPARASWACCRSFWRARPSAASSRCARRGGMGVAAILEGSATAEARLAA